MYFGGSFATALECVMTKLRDVQEVTLVYSEGMERDGVHVISKILINFYSKLKTASTVFNINPNVLFLKGGEYIKWNNI